MISNRPPPAILQIRDFIEHVELDPTRPDKGLVMQLRISLNIPDKVVHLGRCGTATMVSFSNEDDRSGLY
jgi:hypothetical protein